MLGKYISTANEVPSSGISAGVAFKAVQEAELIGIVKLEENQ